MTHEQLIAALERAEGPSRELDADIAWALGHDVTKHTTLADYAHAFPGTPEDAEYWHPLPAYTSSLDAALTVVPEGWDWCIACISGKWVAQVGEADTFMAEGAASNGSAAIALCIAALKAKA